MTINRQNESAFNEGQIAPGLDQSSTMMGHTTNVYEVERAYPTRNRDGVRAGPTQASEELWRDPRYSSSFVGGAVIDKNDRAVYEVQQAPGARGRLASGQAIPAWNAVDAPMKTAFLQGDRETRRDDNPYLHQPRLGGAAANLQSRAPMGDGFQAGERPRIEFGRKIAPVNGGRGRRSEAEVRD